jgi:hypothetical protein
MSLNMNMKAVIAVYTFISTTFLAAGNTDIYLHFAIAWPSMKLP